MEGEYARLGVGASHDSEDPANDGNYDPVSLLGPPYARSIDFWKHLLGCLLFGCLMGVVGYGYLWSIEWVQEQWMGEGYAKSVETVDYFAGDWFWLAVTTFGGLAVGKLYLEDSVATFYLYLYSFSRSVFGD